MRLLACAFVAVSCAVAVAAPPTVAYTVAGTSGDFTLDFSITNNLGVPRMYL